MTHPLQDFADRYTTAWCSDDPHQVAGFFAAEGVLTINGGAPHVGREAIAASAASFMQAFPDLVVALRAVEDVDERVAYHWTLTGTNMGPAVLDASCRSTAPSCGSWMHRGSSPIRWARSMWPTTNGSGRVRRQGA